jgi:hypothetical protein
MKITINNLELDTDKLSSDEKKQLVEACSKRIKLRPEIREEYWRISYGAADNYEWDNDECDNLSWNIGLGFFTEQEAIDALEEMKAIQSIKDYIKENDMEFEPDFKDINSRKYFISYDGKERIFNYNHNYTFDNGNKLPYLKSQEDCEKVIKDCEKWLKIIFKVK